MQTYCWLDIFRKKKQVSAERKELKMCRFLVYVGEHPVLLADLITRPTHSLISQGYNHYLPGVRAKEESLQARNVHLNGDGFGVAWYSPHTIEPCVFTRYCFYSISEIPQV